MVFLAYANSITNPLPSLRDEDEKVYSSLIAKSLRGDFAIHRDSNATIESVNKFLGEFSDDIILFSFSGHAGSNLLMLNDNAGYSDGIVTQLKNSVKNGNLKLVVLNGCSTVVQVKKLLEIGVPAVIATHARIEDTSAKEFAVRFFQNIGERRMTIHDAFQNALGPARLVADIGGGTGSKVARGLEYLDDLNEDYFLWELFYSEPESININPIPMKQYEVNLNHTPNYKLIETLIESLCNFNNAEALFLKQQDYVEISKKQYVIVNNMPHPIGIHLQKLLCPVMETDLGYDKLDIKRLNKIGELFQAAMEFMAIIMISQLWEVKLNYDDKQDEIAKENSQLLNSYDKLIFPEYICNLLNEYYYAPSETRETYNYLPFIRQIRLYFDTLNQGEGIKYFIEELNDLKEISMPGQTFGEACIYLTYLRGETIRGTVREEDIVPRCIQSEDKLCDFFSSLGFLHRYRLTSIRNIDIIKYRHKSTAQFKHKTIKLMHAVGDLELNYFFSPKYLDSLGVVLLKGDIKISDNKRKYFEANQLEFLNLTPFLIDINAFEINNDKTILLSYRQYLGGNYEYSTVNTSANYSNYIELGNDVKFEAIVLQLKAFETIIA